MLFKTTVIIGLGIIGGSLAGALKKFGVSERLIGITRSDAYKRAANIGLIDIGYPLDNLGSVLKDVDLIILAVPIRKICAFIPEIIPIVKQGCIITDVGSTKHAIIAVSNTFSREGVFFIGGHPMAGSEKTGFEAGSAELFQNRPYAIVKGENTPDEIVTKISEMVTKIGAIPIQLDSKTHDRIVAGISHLPQMLAIALMNVIGKENDQDKRFFKMSGPAFIEMTRIAGSSFSVWEDIIISNRLNVSNMLQNLTAELERLQKSVEKLSTKKDFEQANAYRKRLLNG